MGRPDLYDMQVSLIIDQNQCSWNRELISAKKYWRLKIEKRWSLFGFKTYHFFRECMLDTTELQVFGKMERNLGSWSTSEGKEFNMKSLQKLPPN